MVPRPNPLTILTNGFADFIQQSPCVKLEMGMARKNIEAFNKTRTSTLDKVSESDVPEIRLVATGGPTNINIASNIVSMDASYAVQLNSGSQQITDIMYPVLWAVFATMCAGMKNGPLNHLKWRGNQFMRKYEMTNIAAGMSNPELNRGIKGWTAVCDVVFHLYFQSSDIAAYTQGQ